MKWTDWSYKRRNTALIVSFFTIMIIAYFFSFRATFDVLSEVEGLKKADLNNQDLPQEIAKLNKNIHLFDSLIDSNSDNYQTRLMNSLTRLSGLRNVSIVLIEEDEKFSDEQYEVFRIVFQGPFKSLLELTNDIENSYALGSLKSVNFNKEIDKRTKKENLKLAVYLARIRDDNQSTL